VPEPDIYTNMKYMYDLRFQGKFDKT